MTSENSPHQSDQKSVIADPDMLHKSLIHSVNSRMAAKGEVVMPCIPSMLEHYMRWLENLFLLLGRPMPVEVQEGLSKLLAQHLEDGFRAERYSEVVFRYEPSEKSTFGVACTIGTRVKSIADEYSKWVETREPPLFGANPDAKVMAIASSLDEPEKSPILDVGAGTGRNTIPLARLGYPVDALEVTPVFASQIREAAEAEKLPVTVIEGDVLDPEVAMQKDKYRLALVVEVISDLRSVEQLRTLLEKICDLVSSGGLLLFNIFLAVDGYEPDVVAREVSQVMICSIFTQPELSTAMDGLPLELISDESVYEYERDRLPAEAWPPVSWFANWVTGRNVFPLEDGQPPIELRWILCRKL
ncbi:class I SAM-dependent methyltransferase [Microcoleus sp. FACHB-831]|uniref:class I SAM-dependent methyltransferase n=1 Tax=Microcoleus sp. FACHB-831 TaxID=2692827 RepID=UPI001688A92E|nr:class I SAM-dependent methyltransferase [Microcoleus sp. FACHB-831]MBD1924301.1 class I SAM-dependent methyltransferase [Microcoleus sp. FACHB-831]